MTTGKRVTAESLDKEAKSIRRQQERHKARQAKKHLQDLEELFTAVLACYMAQTGKRATVEELTAYYAAELEKLTKKEG